MKDSGLTVHRRTFLPDTNAMIAFAMIFLSFFGIESGVGALIAADFFAFAIVAFHVRSFWRMTSALRLWFVFAGLVITGLIANVVIGINEFAFVGRLFLVVLGGLALALLVRPDRSNLIAILQAACLAYVLGIALFLIFPEFENLVDLKSLKAWVAVAPILLVYVAHARGWPKVRLAALGLVLLVALMFQSRTLLITGLAFITYIYLKVPLAWKIVGAVLIVALAWLLIGQMDTLIQSQEHSNTFRTAMIIQITRFSYLELIIGRGIENWQREGYLDLIHLPGAEGFFETGNPHFLPAEIIIRGGLVWFGLTLFFYRSVARSSKTWVLGSILILGSIFTTNTGAERLILSLGIFIILIGRPEFPYWRTGRSPSNSQQMLPRRSYSRGVGPNSRREP